MSKELEQDRDYVKEAVMRNFFATTRRMLTRGQWKQRGRHVFVSDSDAARTVTDKASGHILLLYSEEQTRVRV